MDNFLEIVLICLIDILIDRVSVKYSPHTLMCVIRHELVALFIRCEENEIVID